jgi:hypothetical protein
VKLKSIKGTNHFVCRHLHSVLVGSSGWIILRRQSHCLQLRIPQNVSVRFRSQVGPVDYPKAISIALKNNNLLPKHSHREAARCSSSLFGFRRSCRSSATTRLAFSVSSIFFSRALLYARWNGIWENEADVGEVLTPFQGQPQVSQSTWSCYW